MQVIRPIQPKDFDALKQIAVESGHGFTSLPNNDEVLSAKIENADNSFNKQVEQRCQENYLFVLEDIHSGEILGTTGINATVGMNTPLYHYRQGSVEQRSTRLNLTNKVNTLTICNDYTGSSEICTLFLRENHRKGMAGRLLSRVRFLFMAEHPHRFSDKIIAEMRGVSDEDGHSPFWHWLKTHYIDAEFPTIDYMVGTGQTEFIPQLMPRFPIYASLLSKDAQSVIGEVHEKTKPALRLLEKEGFKRRGYVDLFDAGPTVESQLDEIKTVQSSGVATVNIAEVESESIFAVCNQKVADFRATHTNQVAFDERSGTLCVSPDVASALQVVQGETVRFVGL
jgi:arginine N-succinyltransferase